MENRRRCEAGQFISQALSFTAVVILLISALLVLSDPAPAEGSATQDVTSSGARP
jgi:hypothetical protein